MPAYGPSVSPGTLHPGYVAGRWYGYPEMGTGTSNSISGGQVRLVPVLIKQPVTIQALGLRVLTAAAGGLIGCAVYAADPSTKYPTGAPLASNLGLSTTTVTTVSAAAGPATLSPGLYYFATLADSTGATASFLVSNQSSASLNATGSLGSVTLSNLSAGTQLFACLNSTQTYGSWPTFNGSALSEAVASNVCVFFQAA